MRKISCLLAVLSALACVSCGRLTEVKPLLKPGAVTITQRIADQEKWIGQDLAAGALKPAQAREIRTCIEQIRKKYDLLKAGGTLTRADSENINQMLDQTSEQIFRMSTKM